MNLSKTPIQPSGLLALSTLALTLCAGSAQAAPVAEWTFVTETTFTHAVFENKRTGILWPDRGVVVQNSSEISWGRAYRAPAWWNSFNEEGNFQRPGNAADRNRSALTIGQGDRRVGGGAATGSVKTAIGNVPGSNPGEIGLGNSITHWNNTIAADFNTLLSGGAQATLSLSPVLPAYYDSTPLQVESLVFDFNFYETPNNGGSNGRCVDGVPASQYPGGCPDLFGFPISTLNKSFELFDPVDDIMRIYYAHLFVFDESGAASPIQQLSAGECGALNLSEGCLGFRTAEAGATTAQFAFAVTTDRITLPGDGSDEPGNQAPEPGMLALLGLGLAGLRLLQRRQS